MKKALIFILILTFIFPIPSNAVGEIPENCTIASNSHTETTPYNWYFRKTTDHSQPSMDTLFSFTKDTDAYFIDNIHSDYNSSDKVIYLTFDAGYENGNVEKTLDILKENDVPGAFFVLENLIKKNPELIKRMDAEGHLVCNHTATHKDMSKITSKEEFTAELERLNEVCIKETGVKIAPFYRPPEGRFSELNLRHASEAGYKTIFWSFAYVDWNNDSQMSPEKATQKVLEGTHNGEILLLHPTSATNALILDGLIKSWKSDGFRFGTLNELVK